ncbi:MAG TPA: AAA family ATPase [Tepidisphaeraceae bacterium]|nr:AAA family ATPase [Tepidisphaeraceae bacterium]
MSQEIQLSSSPQTLPIQPTPWSTGTGLTAPQTSNTPLGKIHQHLRGRYILTVALAGMFAIAGGAAGFFLPRPAYQSMGTIEVKPFIVSPELYDKVMPMYQQYVATAMAKIHSERVMNRAMTSPDWLARRSNNHEALAEFSRNLSVRFPPSGTMIDVVYTDDHPDAKEVCPIAVSSVIKAYQEIYGDEDNAEIDKKILFWNDKVLKSGQTQRQQRERLDGLLATNGDDLQKIYEEKFKELVSVEKDKEKASQQLEEERDQLKKAEARAGGAAYSVEDLTRVDLAMQEMYKNCMKFKSDAEELESHYGMKNPAAILARSRMTLGTAAMNKYADDLRRQYFIEWKPDSTGGVLIPRDLSVKEAAVKRVNDQYESLKRRTDELGRRSQQVASVRAELTKTEEELTGFRRMVDLFNNQKAMMEKINVVDPQGNATIANDRRIAFTALGTLVGGGLPVGLLLLASLMNPRFRFSDDAAAQPTTGGLTLLGILPDLPDRLSDPEQASIAAHCVHQIRTMLQINTDGTQEERRVFAVTSAAPGDGKTSLTLALGLSYAACGTRTLLIDCDLIGAGLTSRMNVNASEGVLEAIAHRSLLEYVRSTDIADVAILPVGTGQSLHASTLSPAALRRLIEEAKKHFDTILVDTGPVLGSIEASLVAAAVDSVVLTVSRGQPRPIVEKTIQHLNHIGAHLAGVVFNRAQSADFDRSISGISLRSASKGTGHNTGPRMGPVARAVQSAFKP